MNEWISVKDRLPEVPKDRIFVEVLALHQEEGSDLKMYDILRYYAPNDLLPHYVGWHYQDTASIWDQIVDLEAGLTHWMYLPEPPKED